MRFWVDVDNAPHVLVVRPLVEWLKNQGHDVEITARDFGQTLPLLKLFGMPHTAVGRHGGKNLIGKVLTLGARSVSLFFFAHRRGFAAVFSHGSRGVFAPARLLGIPIVLMTDYEHASFPRFMLRWLSLLLVPEIIPREVFLLRGVRPEHIRPYPGLKEDLYVHDFDPDQTVLNRLGINAQKPVVLLRPPASMAHYHVKEADRLLEEVLRYFRQRLDIEVVLLPRTRRQEVALRKWVDRQPSPNIRIPAQATFGPNLIYHSDVVISGGGTMNREAACMGVPVFTIFKGTLGAVDNDLIRQGKLSVLEGTEMLASWPFRKIPRRAPSETERKGRDLAAHIGRMIVSAARSSNGRKGCSR